MLLSKKNIIKILLYLMIFFNAFGLDRPSFVMGGINIYLLFYILLILLTLNEYKNINQFFKICKKCKVFLFLSFGLMFNIALSSHLSIYYLDNISFTIIPALFRIVIYGSFFIIIPYIIYKYKINIEKTLYVWLIGVVIDSFLFYFDSPHIGKVIYLNGQNILGFYIAFSIFFSFYFFNKNLNNNLYIKSIFYLILSLFLLASSLFTWSKGSWVSIIVSFLVVFGLDLLKRKNFKFSFFILFFLIIVIVSTYDIIISLVTNEWSASSGSHSNEERLLSIIAGLKELVNSYFIGVGHKNYPNAIEYFNIEGILWIQPDPHNTYIQLLSEDGLLSFFIFVYLLFFIFKMLNINKLLDLYLFGSLIAMSIYGNFTGQLLSQQFLYLFASIVLGYYLQNKIGYAKNNFFN